MRRLLTAAAVRERCGIVFAAAERGETRHFRLDPRPPRRSGPPRRRHHAAALSRSRGALSQPLAAFLGRRDRSRGARRARRRRGRSGAGADRSGRSSRSCSMPAPGRSWRYREAETGLVLARSEGLAVASLRAMQGGLFSADPADPWRADAAALCRDSAGRARRRLPARPREPARRASRGAPLLLRRLGEVCGCRPDLFGAPARLGNLYDFWLRAARASCRPPDMLRTLLLRRSGRSGRGASASAACRSAIAAGIRRLPGDGLVPFHKLSQWLVYSLIEPLDGSRVADHRYRRADRPRRISQRRAVSRLRRDRAARPRPPASPARPVERARRRMAGTDRGLARPPGGAGARAARQERRQISRSPKCSKAAAGPPAAKSPPSAARTARRRSRSSATGLCSRATRNLVRLYRLECAARASFGARTASSCPSSKFVLKVRVAASQQLVEQRLCVLQIGGVEALGEPAVNRARADRALRPAGPVRPTAGRGSSRRAAHRPLPVAFARRAAPLRGRSGLLRAG